MPPFRIQVPVVPPYEPRGAPKTHRNWASVDTHAPSASEGRMDLLALQCLSRDSRDSGESREVVLAKKELRVSEERIKDLEEAVRSRAEVQALMEAEQQQMLRQ